MQTNPHEDTTPRPQDSIRQTHHTLEILTDTQFTRHLPGSDDLVVMARGHTPDPIPNSAVKTLSANGTAS